MANNKMITCLLPMKLHSERVPNKNYRLLGHKPLYRWMLDKLLDVNEISKIVINTDAIHILEKDEIFQNEKIILRQRPEHLIGDLVSMNKIIEDDLENVDSDIFLMTHTTNPFLEKQSIKEGIIKFLKGYEAGDCDSLFTVNKIQTRFYDSSLKPINHYLADLKRTQDLEVWYEENSNFYIFTKDSFFINKNRIGNKPLIYENNKLECLDIDTQDEWDFAEKLVNSNIIKDN